MTVEPADGVDPRKELEKFSPVHIRLYETLKDEHRLVIAKLLEVSEIIDTLFLQQVYDGNVKLNDALEEEGGDLLDLFNLHYGPFDRLNHNVPFIKGHQKPKGANFYPPDMTKQEFKQHLDAHPDQRDAFESTVTVITRKGAELKAIPYSKAYADLLGPAAELLEEAAALSTEKTLQEYLKKLATAFRTNEYFESDCAWMDLQGDLEVVIGPYEVYEDELMGLKASFESFIGLRDHAASEKLEAIASHIGELESALPLPEEHKNTTQGTESPIVIANLLSCAGDGHAGVQFTAFNLPNDEKVREAKGSKKVLLKNVAEAKFAQCWQPILERLIEPELRERISFDAYFTHILLHEISHGIGPGTIVVDRSQTTVSKALKELYPTIEEAKADILGILGCLTLSRSGVLDAELVDRIIPSAFAGIFRSVRFGISEAHAGANIIAYNWLLAHGAIHEGERFDIVPEKAETAVRALAEELLLIQATGDYERAKKLIDQYRRLTPAVEAALERITDVPVDIRPIFPDILGKK